MALPLLAIAIFGVALSAALLAFWTELLSFVKKHITPWLHKHFPELAHHVDSALASIDNLMVEARRRVKAAWESLRRKLLKVLVSYEHSSNAWVRRAVSWCVRKLEDREQIVKRTEVEEVVYDDVPQNIRAAWIKGQGQTEEDITAKRDQELAMGVSA
jgi:hypothetical protein